MGIINKINGKVLAQMMISGAHNLHNNQKIVDELNVFPVPDGDTGTNMSMTIMALATAIEQLQSTSVTKVADAMAHSTLRGARGNSGVILSQFFRGISKRLKGISDCTPLEFAESLKEGVDTAYRAVMNPTEGTILTVSKEAAISSVVEANKGSEFVDVMKTCVTRGNKTLAKTQNMLPALKQAGVVDAGGQGWMFILEGILYYLQNNTVVELTSPAIVTQKSKTETNVLGDIKFMYCTEFIIEKKTQRANIETFRHAIESKGDCMLVIDDDDIVKVHIHTNNPGFVLERAVKLGEIINIKIDNMKHQHQSILEDEPKEEYYEIKDFAFVAVCVGDGLCNILKDIGVDKIIEGGQSMNPSTEDILNACEKINANTIFIFPNNKNIILAAQQACEISKKNLVVIPTKTIPECVAAMLAFQPNSQADINNGNMCDATKSIKTGQVTFAVRDTVSDGIEIKKDDILGMYGKKIICAGDNYNDVCLIMIEDMLDDDSEFVTLYYGQDISENTAQKLSDIIEAKYEDIEVSVKSGGQPLYYYIVSVE